MKPSYIVLVIIVFMQNTSLFGFLPPAENGFTFDLGAGGIYQPLYTGSSTYKFQPFPHGEVRYTHDELEIYGGIMNGVGTKISDKTQSYSLDISARMGMPRSPKDEKRLEGSPEIKNVAYLSCTLDLSMLQLVGLSTVIEYYPVTADYSESGDMFYNGVLITPTGMISTCPLPGLFVSATAKLSIMNDDYASAYFGNKSETEYLKEYKAKGGLHSAGGGISFMYLFNEHVYPALFFDGMHLLGDAQKSPLSESDVMLQGALMCLYRF